MTETCRQVKSAAEAAYDTVGHEFHLGSPKQLQALLFDELGPVAPANAGAMVQTPQFSRYVWCNWWSSFCR